MKHTRKSCRSRSDRKVGVNHAGKITENTEKHTGLVEQVFHEAEDLYRCSSGGRDHSGGSDRFCPDKTTVRITASVRHDKGSL